MTDLALDSSACLTADSLARLKIRFHNNVGHKRAHTSSLSLLNKIRTQDHVESLFVQLGFELPEFPQSQSHGEIHGFLAVHEKVHVCVCAIPW